MPMFIDGGRRWPIEPPRKQRRDDAQAWPVLLSVGLAFAVPIVVWQIARAMMTFAWR